MLAAWIYNNPPWLVTSTFVIIALAFTSLVMASVHRLANHALRHEHRELTCFTVSNISVLYAVLLAFIAVATWENFERASETVETEADLANNLCRDTRGFDQPVATSLQHGIRRYLAVVIEQEWPIQQNGGIPSAGWRELDRIHNGIAALTPNNTGETVLMQEMLHTLNELYSARMSRLNAVRGHIPSMIWWVILLVGALVIVYSCFLAAQCSTMHLTMLAGLVMALTLVIALIVQLDYPFRGVISVSAEPFQHVLEATAGFDKPLDP